MFRIKLMAIMTLVAISGSGSAFGQGEFGAAKSPKVGDTAPEFSLKALDDRSLELRKLTAEGPVVLIVLRGWPGYQCPLCTRQVGEFLGKSKEFEKRGAKVVLVYPGPKDKLEAHAKEFMKETKLPSGFELVIDPDYTFTNAYGLRWEAKGETAYPSTFVIGKGDKILYSLVSKSHGGRAASAKVLEVLEKAK